MQIKKAVPNKIKKNYISVQTNESMQWKKRATPLWSWWEGLKFNECIFVLPLPSPTFPFDSFSILIKSKIGYQALAPNE